MHRMYAEARRLTMDFNTRLYSQEEGTAFLTELTGQDVAPGTIAGDVPARFIKNVPE